MQQEVVPAAMAGEVLPGEVLVEMLERTALLELLERGPARPIQAGSRHVAGRGRVGTE